MTSGRVYKPRYEPSYAKDQIVSAKSTEFDPVVVDAMLGVFEDFIAICEEHRLMDPSTPVELSASNRFGG